MLYTYYTLSRPATINSIPTDGIREINNFDCRRNVGNCLAWSRVYYDRPLTAEELADCEMSDNRTIYKSIIIRDLHDLAIEALENPDDENIVRKYEKADVRRQSTYKRLFEMLKDGKIDIFYFDKGKAMDFNRYLFTRSVKECGKIQKSCLWYKAQSDIIPMSDSNRETWEEFDRNGDLLDGVTIYYK